MNNALTIDNWMEQYEVMMTKDAYAALLQLQLDNLDPEDAAVATKGGHPHVPVVSQQLIDTCHSLVMANIHASFHFSRDQLIELLGGQQEVFRIASLKVKGK